MTRQRGTGDAYTGFSGQMAVMSELLFRRCNVAVPVLDVGTDLFAFLDDRVEIAPLQIKAGRGVRYRRGEGCRGQFDLPMKQLKSTDDPPLFYALALRLEEQWTDFLILSRFELRGYWAGPFRFGTVNEASGNLVLSIQFRPGAVVCGEVNLTAHRNGWNRLPPLHGRADSCPPGTSQQPAGPSPQA